MDSTSPQNPQTPHAFFMAPILLPLRINRKFARLAYLHTPAGIICC
jgi:hypothetical protein